MSPWDLVKNEHMQYYPMGLQLRGGFEAFLAHFWKEILFKEMSLVIKRRWEETGTLFTGFVIDYLIFHLRREFIMGIERKEAMEKVSVC